MKNVKRNCLFIFALAVLFVSLAAIAAIAFCPTAYAQAKKIDETVRIENKTAFDVSEFTDILEEPTRLGYNFVGWYSDADCNNSVTELDGIESGTVYAKWQEKTIYECYNTQSDVYEISTLNQLSAIRDLKEYSGRFGEEVIEGNFSLLTDITMTGYWTPIEYPFAGTFEGNGHKIFDMKILVFGSGEFGLFKRLKFGTINNLDVSNVAIANSFAANSAPTSVGVITGIAQSSTINNCTVSGGIVITAYYSWTGGIAGSIDQSYIYDCSSSVDITSYGSIGGITASAIWYSEIERCENHRTLSYVYNTNNACVAGIVGKVQSYSTVYGCTNYGSVVYAGDLSLSTNIKPCMAQIVGWKLSGSTVGNNSYTYGTCDKGKLLAYQAVYFSTGEIGRVD